MQLLQKPFFKEYGVPILVTAVMHAILLIWLAADFGSSTHEPLVKKPKSIQAKLVQLKEKKTAKKPVRKKIKKPKKKKPNKKTVDKKKQQAKAKKLKKQRAAKLAKDKKKKDQALKEKMKKQALERKRLEQQAKDEQVQQRHEDDFMSDFAEDEQLAEDQADTDSAMSYMGVIQAAVEEKWSRPASARNGMQVTLAIQLFPTGAVNNVNVIASSGNDAFDRSAVAAVNRAERFPELAELKSHVFEKYYRSFSLLFKPEDLRL